jgi:hypothetical protein
MLALYQTLLHDHVEKSERTACNTDDSSKFHTIFKSENLKIQSHVGNIVINRKLGVV